MIDFNDFKCRCSAIHKMMSDKRGFAPLTELQEKAIINFENKEKLTEKQQDEYALLLQKRENSKKIVLSDTCIEYLMEVYAWETEKMIPVGKEAVNNLATQKGKEAEKEAIALISIHDDVLYLEHKGRIENDYLSGQIDCYLGYSVYDAENVTDIKNSWDYPTFLKKIHTGLENGQEEQLQGYGDITGSKELYVANCLITASEAIISEMKYKIANRMGALTTETPEFLAEWAKWERSMRFTHMKPQSRVSKIKVEPFSEFRRQQVYDRVKVCRDWLNSFHEIRTNLVPSMQNESI
jgi:hypothetical protein